MQRKKMTENKNRGDGKYQDEEQWMKKENLKQQTELLFICRFHTGQPIAHKAANSQK